MGDQLYVAAVGALARMQELEVVANNLANVDTIGFKQDRPGFGAVLESALVDPKGRPTPGAPGRSYVSFDRSSVDLSPGGIRHTGAPLDVAIRGAGLFVVQTEAGPRYTRAGSFVIDAEGMLSTPTAHRVQGPSGSIRIEGGQARILANGEVVGLDARSFGRLEVVELPQGAALVKDGSNLFRLEGSTEPQPVEEPKLAEGSVEGSNVVPVREMSELVSLQRAYDAAMQALGAHDQILQRLLKEVGS